MPKVSHSSSHTHNHSPILGGTDPQSVTQRPTLTGVTENTEAHYTDRTRRPVVSKHKSVQRQSHTQTAPPEHSITVTDVHSFTTPSHTVAQSHLSAQDRPGSHTAFRVPAPAASVTCSAGAMSRRVSGPSGKCCSFRKEAEAQSVLGLVVRVVGRKSWVVSAGSCSWSLPSGARCPARLSPRPAPPRRGFWEATSPVSGRWACFQSQRRWEVSRAWLSARARGQGRAWGGPAGNGVGTRRAPPRRLCDRLRVWQGVIFCVTVYVIVRDCDRLSPV